MSRMKTGFWSGVLVVWSGLLLVMPVAQAQVTSTWSSAVDGYWNDGSKWDKGAPLAGTNASLTAIGSYTVTCTNPVSPAIGQLIITNASGNTTTFNINTNFNLGAVSFVSGSLLNGAVNVNNGAVVSVPNTFSGSGGAVLNVNGGQWIQANGTLGTASQASTITLNMNGGYLGLAGNGNMYASMTMTAGVVNITGSAYNQWYNSTLSGGVFSNSSANLFNIRSSTFTVTNQGRMVTIGMSLSGQGEVLRVDGGTVEIYSNNFWLGNTTYSGSYQGLIAQTAGLVSMTNAAGLIIGNSSGALNTTSTNQYQLSGGTLHLQKITFGAAGDVGTNNNAFKMSGGVLNLGSGGMVTGTAAVATYQVRFSGGTVGAQSDWSSYLNMILTNNPAPGLVTFRASDTNNVAHNITLSGVLSGSGGLIKTGAGVLTLSGVNTYYGATIVSNGTLQVNGIVTGKVTVAGGTLGGTGVLSGTVTNQAIISANGVTTVGTMTITNLVMAENSAYTWNYGDSSNDLIDIKGFLTLPAVATVTVSRASGSVNALPASATLFTAPVINNPSGVSGWVVTGALPTSRVKVSGNQVQLVTPTGWVMYVN